MNRLATASLFLLLVASWIVLCPMAGAAETATPEAVLIVYGNQRPLPANVIIDDALRKTIFRELGRPVEIFNEYLEVERFDTAQYVEAQAEFLRDKYVNRNIRVIVAVSPPALEFVLDHRDRIGRGVPIVHVAVPRDQEPAGGLPPDVVGATLDQDPTSTFELAQRLQPAAKRLVIVTGAADRDLVWTRRIRDAVARLDNRLEVEYLTALPTADVLRRLGALPRDTIVYTPGYFADGTGLVMTPVESVEQMAAASTAPLYGPNSTYLGKGAVGGCLSTFDDMGKHAGDLVARLLNGTAPAAITASSMQNFPMVDWRQLRRWGLDEKLLPVGTRVLFKPPSIWEQDDSYAIGVLLICALQAAMITSLLLQRARQRRVEDTLRENHQLMELAASAGEFGMWGRDLSKGGVWASASLRSLFGLGENDALRLRELIARIHPDDSARVMAAVQLAQQRDEPFEGEFRALRPDGTQRWMLGKGRVVADPRSGRDPRGMGVVIDITERKRVEKELAEQRSKLAHLSRVSALGQLSAAIAHELNQPLTTILSNAEAAQKMLTREQVDLAELREICDDIVTADHRASEVIGRLRALFKRGATTLQPLDINEVIRDTLDLLHGDFLTRHTVAVTDLEPALPAVDGDRVQLQQVLVNLIINATDAMDGNAEDERKFVIRTEAAGVHVRICVSDRGPGIDAAHMEHIFEPFWSSKSEGMGMGLAICQSIVAAHGGSLTASSSPEGGATFCATLPARGAT